jgi:hypothetical protein
MLLVYQLSIMRLQIDVQLDVNDTVDQRFMLWYEKHQDKCKHLLLMGFMMVENGLVSFYDDKYKQDIEGIWLDKYNQAVSEKSRLEKVNNETLAQLQSVKSVYEQTYESKLRALTDSLTEQHMQRIKQLEMQIKSHEECIDDERRRLRAQFQEEMDRKAIPAGSMPQTPPATRSMRSTAPDIPEMSTEQPPAGRKSFGSRILDALTRGGATDVRNMLGAAAPAAMKGFRTVADIGKTVREGKARAALEKAGRQTGKRDKDIERMESESPAQVTPRMPNRKEPPGPRDLDELRMSGEGMGFKKGGKTKKYAQGGSVSSRADGIAKRGRTNCKIC